MRPEAWVNGRTGSAVDPLDRGFQYGDGVFTTLRVEAGAPVFLGHHFDRLQRDCGRLAIPYPGSAVLLEEVRSLLAGRLRGVLKIQLTRGAGGRGYRPPPSPLPTRVLVWHPPVSHSVDDPASGILARYCRTPLGINPTLAGIKHMNRLEQVLARAEWPEGPIAEGLMLDTEGCVVEGTMSNVFIVQGKRLLTPLLDRCGVDGVMRGLIREAAAELGFGLTEGRLTPAELAAADEIFFTNSVIGIWPVRQLEQQAYRIGPVSLELAEWLKNTTKQAISAWSAA